MSRQKTLTRGLTEDKIEDRRSKRRKRLDRTMRVVNMLDFLRDSRNKEYDGARPKLVRRQMRATG